MRTTLHIGAAVLGFVLVACDGLETASVGEIDDDSADGDLRRRACGNGVCERKRHENCWVCPQDCGACLDDGGAIEVDAGAPGNSSPDAGEAPADAGTSPDSGAPVDAGPPVDPPDAGAPPTDAGSPIDSGVLPDAGRQDAGPGSGGSGGGVGTRIGFPCTNCMTLVPSSYQPAHPNPLLVALHGDEGAPSIIVNYWQGAALDAGYILFAPECPRSEGCTGSWWQWNHSMAWLFAQVDLVAAEYNIDLSRVYASGASGGAFYLGYRADELAPRFAGVNYLSGGYHALSGVCPVCPLPAYILDGDQDYTLYGAEYARDYFLACGSETVYDLLPGVTHQGVAFALAAGKGAAILQWFDARPNACGP